MNMSRLKSPAFRSDYRLEIIAEILDYGHAACKNEKAYRKQIDCWSVELAEIPTKKLFNCFVLVKRNRESCGVQFYRMALRIDEVKAVWKILKNR